MIQINTIDKFHKYLNSIENVSLRIDKLDCEIYISNSLIAKGKAISIDTKPFEIPELLETSVHTTIEKFFFNEKKIFYSNSHLQINTPSGNINEFLEYLFYKYPSIEPLEYSIEKQSNELNYTINQLTSVVLELRIANYNTKQDLIKKSSELYESITANKSLEAKIEQILRTSSNKDKFITPVIQYFVKELNCISSSQYNSICSFENIHFEEMNNKTVCVYEQDSLVCFSFNPTVYIDYQDKDLAGLSIPDVSSERKFILFDKKGDRIVASNIEGLNIKFELDWDTFKKLELTDF